MVTLPSSVMVIGALLASRMVTGTLLALVLVLCVSGNGELGISI